MSDRKLNFAGDVLIREITLTSLNGQTANITNQVELIKIYEDLFSPFITMSISLVESVDYINLFPFCGEEYVEIDIDTPTLNIPIKGRFYVNSIEDYTKLKERQVAYILKCVSEEWLIDVNKKLNKPYSGNCSEMASLIIGKDGYQTKKNKIIEPSNNSTKFIPAFWSPSKCLNYLASSAISKNKSPSFLFFENRSGFNFLSLNSIIAEKRIAFSFIKDNYSRDLTANSSIKNPNEDYKRIISYEVPSLANYLEDIDSARLKSRMITFDMTTKKYASIDYSLRKETSKSKSLNEFNGYSNHFISSAASNIFVVNKYSNNYSNYIDVSNAKIIQKRQSFFGSLKKYTLNIEVIGRTDYTIGMIVDVTIPKSTQIIEGQDPRDMILSGKYLVSALCHSITRERHTCNMELIKDSLLIDLNKK